jgi:hypothetical protein
LTGQIWRKHRARGERDHKRAGCQQTFLHWNLQGVDSS